MKAWIVNDESSDFIGVFKNPIQASGYESATTTIEEVTILSVEDLRTHNEKIARAAFEAGRELIQYPPTRGRIPKYSAFEDFLQSPEYKELVGVEWNQK